MAGLKWVILIVAVFLGGHVVSAQPAEDPVQSVPARKLPGSEASTDRDLPAPFLRVEGTRIVDSEGRQVLLHGLNVISKSKAENYLSCQCSKCVKRCAG